MADEMVKTESTPQEEKTVTQVTDADLSSAWESTQEQTAVETPEVQKEEIKEEPKEKEHQEPDELPEEPADNAERSRLGRRLKQMEETQKQLLDELHSLRGGQPQQVQSPVQQQVPDNVTYNDQFIQGQIEAAVERGEIPATIVTPQDQLHVTRFMDGLQKQIGNQYANQYIGTLNSQTLKGQTPDEIHAEVVAELYKVESPFNVRRYNNPQLDAQMNYLEAKNAILMRKFSEKKPENVFKGKPKDAPPTGTSISTRTETVSNDIPDLDAASQDFIKRTGMSVDSVKNALKNEMPYYLRGR